MPRGPKQLMRDWVMKLRVHAECLVLQGRAGDHGKKQIAWGWEWEQGVTENRQEGSF